MPLSFTSLEIMYIKFNIILTSHNYRNVSKDGNMWTHRDFFEDWMSPPPRSPWL